MPKVVAEALEVDVESKEPNDRLKTAYLSQGCPSLMSMLLLLMSK